MRDHRNPALIRAEQELAKAMASFKGKVQIITTGESAITKVPKNAVYTERARAMKQGWKESGK